MKKIFVLYIMCLGFNFQSQAQTDISGLVDKLDWSSFDIERGTYAGATISFNENSKAILKEDKKSAKTLIKNIDDEKKFVAIHLLLTKIWCPDKLSDVKIKYIYDIEDIDNGEIVKEIYTINKLVFIKDIENETYLLSKKSMKKIKEYWSKQTSIKLTN